MKLGDRVRGWYGDLEVEGVVTEFDTTGGVYLTCEPPVTYLGIERTGFFFSARSRQRCELTVVAEGRSLTESDVGYEQGYFYLS